MPPSPPSVHVIACAALRLDIRHCAETLGLPHSMEYLEAGLHERPNELRDRLQTAINQTSQMPTVSRIVVAYGVCGRGTVGLRAGRVPLVLPNAQDCIAMFLGSDAAYREQFKKHPGTYYVSAGWVKSMAMPFASGAVQTPGAAASALPTADPDALRERFGADHAETILDFMRSWQRNYQRVAYVDTGSESGSNARNEDLAQTMARECGLRYERLSGSTNLIESLLTAESASDAIAVIPPYHYIDFDPMTGQLIPVPEMESDGAPEAIVTPPSAAIPSKASSARLGLGIDAGGTYTDAVIYDFQQERRLAKAKALTTPWDFTIGICQALAALKAPDRLAAADLVCVSTTLATNAIVEGRGQTVGLLVFPPYGNYHSDDFDHSPTAPLRGRLDVDGRELEAIDEDQIRSLATEMIVTRGVEAFAVSGFGAAANPAHELRAREIIRFATGKPVTCGHELSGRLNFRTRAETAVLNARIMPLLECFLDDARRSLSDLGIGAPIMVVKGDGMLMSESLARERPVETILSGPAASVAGARRLTGAPDAIVVDMGGTTSDIARLTNDRVQLCEEGASVGGWRTHVQALDMRAVGLGGDSRVHWRGEELVIGPRRVMPFARLAEEGEGLSHALTYLESRWRDFIADSAPMEIVARAKQTAPAEHTDREKRMIEILGDGPMSIAQLADRLEVSHWKFLNLRDLEDTHAIYRAALTPTDALHVLGDFRRWNVDVAERSMALWGRLMNRSARELAQRIREIVSRRLTVEILRKQFEAAGVDQAFNGCETCQSLLDHWLTHSEDHPMTVSIRLRHPIIGLGAPAAHFLADAARPLETSLIVPEDADVANAIGAVTSRVRVNRTARILPNTEGKYTVAGLPDSPTFEGLETAGAWAQAELERRLVDDARRAGTSEEQITRQINDRLATSADGGRIFLERILEFTICGAPDLARALRDRKTWR